MYLKYLYTPITLFHSQCDVMICMWLLVFNSYQSNATYVILAVLLSSTVYIWQVITLNKSTTHKQSYFGKSYNGFIFANHVEF